MSGVDIAGLVERLRALPTMAGSWVDTVRNEAADALLAQAAELAEAREHHAFATIGWEKERGQRDEALAALKASEERGERLSQELASARWPQETMFPIMGGPNVSWSLIAPYEDQARTNHGQTLKRLAERGGLSICEAMAVMSSVRYDKRPIAKPNVEDWLDFIAERKAKAMRRARSALEDGPASLADATNNPPSDPGTGQREAGR